MKPKSACISSTVLSFFPPLDYFHSTTISVCDYSACVTSSNLPLLFPNWEAGRHMSWRRVAGSGFASQLVSASSHVRWCQLRDFCFVSEKILCREAVSAALLCFWWPHPGPPCCEVVGGLLHVGFKFQAHLLDFRLK